MGGNARGSRIYLSPDSQKLERMFLGSLRMIARERTGKSTVPPHLKLLGERGEPDVMLLRVVVEANPASWTCLPSV